MSFSGQRSAFAAATLAILLSLPRGAPRLAAQAAQTKDRVFTMEKFEVNAPRFRWTHAQSSRFEILSNLDDTKFVSGVVTQAGQIISLFEKASPLFNPRRDLPVKLIFIQDEIVGRLFAQADAGSIQEDVDERMAGAPFHRDTQQFQNRYRVSALGNHNDEQLVIVKFLSKDYMAGRQSERDKSIECAADLAVTYLDESAQIRAGGKNIAWVCAALNAMRGHAYGGKFPLPREFASPVYGSGSFQRSGWIGINSGKNGDTLTLGRYCLKCEIDALRTAYDFPRTFDGRGALWADYMLSPGVISLGDIFSGPFSPWFIKVRLIEQQLAMQREVHDFMYYCLFGPDDGARAAFTKLAQVASSSSAPIDETLFKKIFGADYATFQGKMYDYYRWLAEGDSFCANNPWGATGLAIKLPPPDENAGGAKAVELKLARHCDITRIISDWFDVCGAGAGSRESLLKARAEDPQAAQDPQFIATLGLNEACYGERPEAVELLEKAAAAGIMRPRVYRTLARLRLENIIALKGADCRLTAGEFRGILEPLATAFGQPQPSPENYEIYAAACEHADAGVISAEACENRVAEGCRMFPGDIDMLEKILPALAGRGCEAGAVKLARESARLPLPPEKKQRLEKLIEKLESGGSRAGGALP